MRFHQRNERDTQAFGSQMNQTRDFVNFYGVVDREALTTKKPLHHSAAK